MYEVSITDNGGNVTSGVMSWAQVRRYLPGGKLFGTVARVEMRRIVKGA